jgi:hypothetical protein
MATVLGKADRSHQCRDKINVIPLSRGLDTVVPLSKISCRGTKWDKKAEAKMCSSAVSMPTSLVLWERVETAQN